MYQFRDHIFFKVALIKRIFKIALLRYDLVVPGTDNRMGDQTTTIHEVVLLGVCCAICHSATGSGKPRP